MRGTRSVGLRAAILGMGLRGFTWNAYVADNGEVFAVKVDADYAVAPERGWVATDPAITPGLPRGFSPRRATGYDEAGHRQHAVVARVDAPLWTGEQEVFFVTGNDAVDHPCNVVGLIAEHRVPFVGA